MKNKIALILICVLSIVCLWASQFKLVAVENWYSDFRAWAEFGEVEDVFVTIAPLKNGQAVEKSPYFSVSKSFNQFIILVKGESRYFYFPENLTVEELAKRTPQFTTNKCLIIFISLSIMLACLVFLFTTGKSSSNRFFNKSNIAALILIAIVIWGYNSFLWIGMDNLQAVFTSSKHQSTSAPATTNEMMSDNLLSIEKLSPFCYKYSYLEAQETIICKPNLTLLKSTIIAGHFFNLAFLLVIIYGLISAKGSKTEE